jgi:hypothetical protein
MDFGVPYRVRRVAVNPDGTGDLLVSNELAPYSPRDNGSPPLMQTRHVAFALAPRAAPLLRNKTIWMGSHGIYMGEVRIAKLADKGGIVFEPEALIDAAIKGYDEGQRDGGAAFQR